MYVTHSRQYINRGMPKYCETIRPQRAAPRGRPRCDVILSACSSTAACKECRGLPPPTEPRPRRDAGSRPLRVRRGMAVFARWVYTGTRGMRGTGAWWGGRGQRGDGDPPAPRFPLELTPNSKDIRTQKYRYSIS